jgi:hypothetical protein
VLWNGCRVCTSSTDCEQHNAKEMVDLTCADWSEFQLNHISKRIKDNGWTNAEAKTINVMVCFSPPSNEQCVDKRN